MASPPPPSEEERRLLREYRLVSIPSRRSSCSPATSNASSLTTTNVNISSNNPSVSNLIDQCLHEPHIAGASQTGHRPANSGKSTPSATHSNSSCNQSQSSSSTTSPPITRQVDCQTSTTTTVATATTPKVSYGSGSSRHSSSSPSPNFINQNSHHHSSSNHHNNTKPHGRHHHPRKHKVGATHLVELSGDDLKQMLNLVSNLSFLKLVSPKTISPNGGECSLANISEDANCNSSPLKNSPTTSGGDADDDNRSSSNDQHNHHQHERVSSKRNGHLIANLMSRNDCEPLDIFEKVDYIKKLNIRRKALRRMKKAEISKSRRTQIVMPNINESPKIM